MGGVRWTPKARISLQEVACYIAREAGRPKAANRLLEAIHAKSESYGRQPMMGSIHEDLPEGFRYFTHKRYVIIYETTGEGIVVHLVVDSAREWTRLFNTSVDNDG